MSTAAPLVTLAVLVGFLFPNPAWAAEGGYIGIQVRKNQDGPGVYVLHVIEGSPAEKTGIKPNDVITKIDGKKVEGVADFVAPFRDGKPGDKHRLTIERQGKEMEISITLARRPAEQK